MEIFKINNDMYRPEKEIIDSIENHFRHMSTAIEARSKNNDHSLNVYLEQALIPILNILFKADLSSNRKSNEPAVDLEDPKKELTIQVTSRDDFEKICETFIKFYKNEKDLKYSKLKFLFLVHETNIFGKVTKEKIEAKLNSEKTLTEINSKRKHPLAKISISKKLFDPENDINILTVVKQNFHILRLDEIESIEKRLNEIWPYFKYRREEFRRIIIENQFTSINEVVETFPITDAINYINNIFSPVKVLPHFILLNLKIDGELLGNYVDKFTLNTNNKNLFEAVKNELVSNKEKPIIEFLLVNNIQMIVYSNSPKSIDNGRYIPNLITNLEKFDECEFDSQFVNKTSNHFDEKDTIDELFTRAYLYVQYGKYLDAVAIYKYIYELSKSGKNIAHFLCLYNLNRLQRQIGLNSDEFDVKNLYGEDLYKEVNSDISKIFTHDITKEELYLINYISNFRQVHDQSELLSIINRTDNVIHLDDIGYPYFDIVNNEWYETLSNKINFISYNRIISELQYLDVKQLFSYMFKSILELCKLKNPTILIKIDVWLFKMSIIHMYSNELQRILNRYKFSSNRLMDPKLLENFADHIIKVLINIEKNEKVLSGYFISMDDDRVPLKTRINDIYSNICIHLLYLNFDSRSLNKCLKFIFSIDINNNIIVPNSYNYLVELFNIKQNKINRSNTKKFLKIYKKYYFAMDQVDQYSEGFISSDEVKEMDYVEVGLDELVDLWEHRRKDINIELVKYQYESKLTTRFSMEYYRLGVMVGIIEHGHFLAAAISSLEVTLNKNRNSFKWEFQKFIEVAYHADINLDGQDFKFLHGIKNEYINWLMDLESFDYERFEPYWLLEWGAPAYYNKFKTIDKLKTKLEEYLAKNDHPTMSRIYFNYFVSRGMGY